MSETIAPTILADNLAEQETISSKVLRFFRTKPLGAIGLLVVMIFILGAIFAEVISPYDPLDINYELLGNWELSAPSAEHLLGADQFGRDLLSRIIYGSRTAMLIGFVASLFGATFGLFIGVASAYFGGKTDLIIQRIVDIFMSFPLIILALAIVTIIPKLQPEDMPSFLQWIPEIFLYVFPVIVAIMIPMIPRCARVVRSSALALREVPYVDAARALGFSHTRIIVRHMVPNVMAPFLIMLTAFMGQAVLLEASLSFLGLGVQEPIPAWGLMLQGGAEEYAETAPWIAILPGVAITLSVFAFNMFGDALRDVLDPRLRV